MVYYFHYLLIHEKLWFLFSYPKCAVVSDVVQCRIRLIYAAPPNVRVVDLTEIWYVFSDKLGFSMVESGGLLHVLTPFRISETA